MKREHYMLTYYGNSAMVRHHVFSFARRKRIPIIEERLGAPYVNYKGDTIRYPHWDGTMLVIKHDTDTLDILHEIAHWIEAPKDRLHEFNFGLDTDPNLDDRENRAILIENALIDLLESVMAESNVILYHSRVDKRRNESERP